MEADSERDGSHPPARADGLPVRFSAIKNKGTITIMLAKLWPQTLESLREHATEGVTRWLTGIAPGIAPERPDSAAEDPSAGGWMQRFVRDIITTNPISRSPLSSVQIYLLEQALGCVDWPASPRPAAPAPGLVTGQPDLPANRRRRPAVV